LLILAVGIAPAILKKSKPLAKYLGEHLIRAGEYLKEGTDEPVAEEPKATTEAAGDGAATEPVEPKSTVKPGAPPKAKPRARPRKKPAAE
jgi:hypothetical protein